MSGHPCLLLDLEGKAFSFSTVKYDVSCRFVLYASHYVKVHKGLLKCIILCLSGMQSLWDTFRKCSSVYISRLKRAIVLIASHFKEFCKCRGQRYIRKWWGQHCSDVLNAILVPPGNREIILIPWLTLQK